MIWRASNTGLTPANAFTQSRWGNPDEKTVHRGPRGWKRYDSRTGNDGLLDLVLSLVPILMGDEAVEVGKDERS